MEQELAPPSPEAEARIESVIEKYREYVNPGLAKLVVIVDKFVEFFILAVEIEILIIYLKRILRPHPFFFCYGRLVAAEFSLERSTIGG